MIYPQPRLYDCICGEVAEKLAGDGYFDHSVSDETVTSLRGRCECKSQRPTASASATTSGAVAAATGPAGNAGQSWAGIMQMTLSRARWFLGAERQ